MFSFIENSKKKRKTCLVRVCGCIHLRSYRSSHCTLKYMYNMTVYTPNKVVKGEKQQKQNSSVFKLAVPFDFS